MQTSATYPSTNELTQDQKHEKSEGEYTPVMHYVIGDLLTPAKLHLFLFFLNLIRMFLLCYYSVIPILSLILNAATFLSALWANDKTRRILRLHTISTAAKRRAEQGILIFNVAIYTGLIILTCKPILAIPVGVYLQIFSVYDMHSGHILRLVVPAISALVLLGYHQRFEEALAALIMNIAIGTLTQSANDAFVALEKTRMSLEQSNEEKSLFVSVVSHEIRGPLFSLNGCLELMSRVEEEKKHNEAQMQLRSPSSPSSPTNQESTKLLQNMKACVDLLMNIVDDILSLAKLHQEAKKGARNNDSFEPCELRKEIRNVANIVRTYSLDQNVQVKTHVDETLPAVVKVQKVVKVHQILINLLTNAIKFSKKNGIVQLNVLNETMESKTRTRLRVEVIDQGSGIPEEKQSMVFTPFFQGKLNQKVPSTGLGLSLVKQIVTVLGGDIHFVSSPNGTKFVVTLPYVKDDSHVTSMESSRVFIPEAIPTSHISLEPIVPMAHSAVEECVDETNRYDVIIAEDSKTNRDILQRILSAEFKVQAVCDGMQLVQAFEKNFFKVVLTDYHMPMLDGVEASTKLRKKYGQNIKIILLSGDDSIDIAAGVVDKILAKPVRNWKQFKEVIRGYL